MKPNVFIIGAPKCGTSALTQYLGGHPNVFMSNPKEPHFFSPDRPKILKMSLDSYLALFRDAHPSVHEVVGEGSTGYLMERTVVPRILEFNPEAKFIVMLRNPIDLAHALHAHRLYEGKETLPDFEEAWNAQGERKRGRKLPFLSSNPRALMYSEWGLLGDQMEALFSVTPRERIKVIILDDFSRDTAAVYRETLTFLGLPPDGRTEFPRINESKAIKRIWLQPYLRFFYLSVKFMQLKLDIAKNMDEKDFLLWNSEPAPKKVLTENFRGKLSDFFRDDVRKLSKLLGRDLSHWVP